MKAYWIVGMMMAAGLPIQAEDCRVDVQVLTGVAMSGSMFADPRVMATDMFRKIGVDVRIHMGGVLRDVSNSCGAPIVIQFDDSTGYPGTADALAYARPYKESGTCIHIFLDRLARRSRDSAFASVLLAHVMVHEITHVLERSIQHSEEGVMKARWSREDYQRMKMRPLPFAPEDAECVREGVAQRIIHAADSKTATGNSPT